MWQFCTSPQARLKSFCCNKLRLLVLRFQKSPWLLCPLFCDPKTLCNTIWLRAHIGKIWPQGWNQPISIWHATSSTKSKTMSKQAIKSSSMWMNLKANDCNSSVLLFKLIPTEWVLLTCWSDKLHYMIASKKKKSWHWMSRIQGGHLNILS